MNVSNDFMFSNVISRMTFGFNQFQFILVSTQKKVMFLKAFDNSNISISVQIPQACYGTVPNYYRECTKDIQVKTSRSFTEHTCTNKNQCEINPIN